MNVINLLKFPRGHRRRQKVDQAHTDAPSALGNTDLRAAGSETVDRLVEVDIRVLNSRRPTEIEAELLSHTLTHG